MPIETQRAWLTEETYGHARIELAELLLRRATGSFVECSDEKQCTRRIRRLQELLGDAIVGYEPPDDGIAEPMASTVRYNAEELTARFLMADREEVAEDDLPVCSPQSPLGTALNGAKAETVASSPFAAGKVRHGERGGRSCSLVSGQRKAVRPRAPPRISDLRPDWAPLPFAMRRRCPLSHGPVADPFQETCRVQ